MIVNKFIATESFDTPGSKTEKLVWQSVQQAFRGRNCIAYWRYPIFSNRGKSRQEADILIADFTLGLIVIEVKGIRIEQIESIHGHWWQYQNFYTSKGNPYQQAETQLFSLLEYIAVEPSLLNKVPGRVMVALPLITQQQWQERGFSQLPSNPPILFQEQFSQSSLLLQHLQATPPVIKGGELETPQWQLLLSILTGSCILTQPKHRVLSDNHSRGQILEKVRSHISSLDAQQLRIAQQIPPGPQRIRGVAGSGKTVILCQKAVLMHLQHPDWQIALVFFTRSLYSQLVSQVDSWLRYYTQNKQSYSPDSCLYILPAWGSKQQQGLYSLLCKQAKVEKLTVTETQNQPPQESLAEACIQLLKQAAVPQIFDAILIDEAQDLVSQNWHYQDKQPFFWLAYQALRPANPLHPEQRRLIWAYDELQSLGGLCIPTANELLGEELGHLVTGEYPGGIKKTEVMSCSYRTPNPVLNFAYGIGMGLYRQNGMLTGMTTREEWEAIGYRIKGDLIPSASITLVRENSPHPLPVLWSQSLIEFQTYETRRQELLGLTNKLIYNLRVEGLRPSKEILVIVLGDFFTASRLEIYVANFLIKQGLDIYLPAAPDCNCIEKHHQGKYAQRFWYEGAITISRIHRAKGQEADLVYLVGLDNIAEAESNLRLRNQLFVAITRSRGWVNLSGVNLDGSPFDEEIRQLLKSPDSLTITFYPPKKRKLTITDAQELLTRYALGERNFRNANLMGANLAGICLQKANLIGANLVDANLSGANLSGVNLTLADLTRANLSGANLKGAKLFGTNLEQTNLTNVDLTGVDIDVLCN